MDKDQKALRKACEYLSKDGSYTSRSDLINLYKSLLYSNRIKKNGPAHKRLQKLKGKTQKTSKPLSNELLFTVLRG